MKDKTMAKTDDRRRWQCSWVKKDGFYYPDFKRVQLKRQFI
jgi:hypothetical protein